ncbi:hydroxymethylglutaryl-CoA lyase [Sphingobacterium alkalisoli]|uniref:Hydroxymethylglutaryl-CoA lyase n=1 Tax=Sphingobacterium alkalisoli TaxID=1874115 RepID=A0A4U0H7F3_9SPHI|nr:hydroxymethylglutaryl-CoA lyase [Sphingobacterium alkalisoli]TJY67793.1 hydroxymethylglutaryl-CoA lyase [Sphingobacterium alkalisoli]GGH11345.1 hydroxymethylglutaryl-CoA lyase [Sphingobacterium alkalisoli]
MLNRADIQLVDCPRDAIQGIAHFIPTEKKAKYINQLIASELFDYIDCGSFVSSKAVPQMRDTISLIDLIQKDDHVKLIAIIANEKGAEIGCQFEKIDYLGYPFSISETFQQRNTNSSISDTYGKVRACKDILDRTPAQQLLIYISMAFGNPYGDRWDIDIVLEWVGKLKEIGIRRFSIADTTSQASPLLIKELLGSLFANFPELDFSIHLHSSVDLALLKINAAYDVGCRTFEGAILGYGGCPFAQDELVGNIPSEMLLDRFGKGNLTQRRSLLVGFQELISRC